MWFCEVLTIRADGVRFWARDHHWFTLRLEASARLASLLRCGYAGGRVVKD